MKTTGSRRTVYVCPRPRRQPLAALAGHGHAAPLGVADAHRRGWPCPAMDPVPERASARHRHRHPRGRRRRHLRCSLRLGGAARLHSAPPNSRLERIHWPTRLAIRRCIIRNSRAWTLPSPAPAAAGTRAKVAASIDAARKGGDATSGEYMPDPPRPTPEQSCCEPVARTSGRVRYRCRVPRFPDLRMKPSDHHISCVQSASTYRYRPS